MAKGIVPTNSQRACSAKPGQTASKAATIQQSDPRNPGPDLRQSPETRAPHWHGGAPTPPDCGRCITLKPRTSHPAARNSSRKAAPMASSQADQSRPTGVPSRARAQATLAGAPPKRSSQSSGAAVAGSPPSGPSRSTNASPMQITFAGSFTFTRKRNKLQIDAHLEHCQAVICNSTLNLLLNLGHRNYP